MDELPRRGEALLLVIGFAAADDGLPALINVYMVAEAKCLSQVLREHEPAVPQGRSSYWNDRQERSQLSDQSRRGRGLSKDQ